MPLTQAMTNTVTQGVPPALAPRMTLILRPQESVKEATSNPLSQLPHGGLKKNKLAQPLWKTNWQFLKKRNRELTF